MKSSDFKPVALVALAMALSVTAAFAQSNGIPGPQDYAKFSQFITDRNIFDPNRQPHFNSGHPIVHHHHTSPPGIQFVGTMSYEKGMFAFFSGNSSDLSKVLQVGDKIVNYTVTAISAANVVLESADQKQVSLSVGRGLKQENGKWVSADESDASSTASAASAPETTETSGNESSSSEPTAPSSAAEPNDVLKRLMQLREKENQ